MLVEYLKNIDFPVLNAHQSANMYYVAAFDLESESVKILRKPSNHDCIF